MCITVGIPRTQLVNKLYPAPVTRFSLVYDVMYCTQTGCDVVSNGRVCRCVLTVLMFCMYCTQTVMLSVILEVLVLYKMMKIQKYLQPFF